MADRKKIRVGVVGYGSLGRYLVKAILQDPVASSQLDLAFVWNRSPEKIDDVDAGLILQDLDKFESL